MADLSSTFDSVWQQYSRGDIAPADFVKRTGGQKGVDNFARWAETKILQEKTRSPIQAASLKKLAEDLAVHNPKASGKIESVFQRVKDQVPETRKRATQPAAEVVQSSKKEKIDFSGLWQKAKDDHFDGFINLFKKNPSSLDQFTDWAHENIVNRSDVETLKSLTEELSSTNADEALVDHLDNLAEFRREVEFHSTEDQRANLSKLAFPLCKGLSSRGIDSILSAVARIEKYPPNERAKIVSLALPLVQGVALGKDRGAIFDNLVALRPDQRDIISRAVNYFPSQYRAALLNYARFLFREESEIKKIEIVTVFSNIPIGLSDKEMKLAAPVLQGVTSSLEKADVLRAVYQMHEDQVESVIDIATHMRPRVLEGVTVGRGAILDAIYDIPPTERLYVVNRAIELKLLEGVSNGAERAKIILRIFRISKGVERNI